MTLWLRAALVAGLVALLGWAVAALIDHGGRIERDRQMRAAAAAESGATAATVPLEKCPPGKWNREVGRCEP